MSRPAKTFLCTTQDGLKGQIRLPKKGQVKALLTLEDGEKVDVPVNLLEERPDHSYYLPVDLHALKNSSSGKTLNRGDALVIPVIEEELVVGTRQTEGGGVRVTKQVHTEQQVVDQPGFMEEVEVERVSLNQELSEPAGVRQEGDTTIIPVMEEILVLEKRLVLREEVRITRRRKEIRDPQTVKLRREEVTVEPVDIEPENGSHSPDKPAKRSRKGKSK